jgi:Winged helix DNA-binding domain
VTAVPVSREQVLGYRLVAQGLDRRASKIAELAVLDIGVQDSVTDGARLAFDARLVATPPVGGVGPGSPLALVWSLRGAPHVHRRRDLDSLTAALWPLSPADAGARMNQTGPHLRTAGIDGLVAFAASAKTLHTLITAPTTKGAASTALTPRVPGALKRYCRVCKVTHVGDLVLRVAALPAGLELEPDSAPPVLVPRAKARWPVAGDPKAVQKLIKAYLTLLGPAGPSEVADYLQARRADLEALWPTGLTEVSVHGRAAWIPSSQLGALRGAHPESTVRLLSPFDPYLQARDRDLIVPDRGAQKVLWPILGRPGVVLVDGEVAGGWRPRASGKKLVLTVEAFGPLPRAVWARIEAEAARVASVRGAADIAVKRKA